MRFRGAISGWIVASLLVSTYGTAQSPTRPGQGSAVRPNVILITVDTLRADRVGSYGAQQLQTPVMDALAHDGLQYDRAVSQVPLTLPAHAAILTGTYPFQNGVQDFTAPPLSSRSRSVAQAFRSAGYRTGAVISSFTLDRSFGLARGFDFYDDAFPAASLQQPDLGLVDRRAQDSVDRALAWLDKNSTRPFFLWLHLYDPHSPYDPPEPFRSKYKEHPYDGEVAYADRELGRLMAWLKNKNLYAGSLIVLTSDHGESLGEHGEQEHGFFLYGATIRVPLIVKPPARRGISPGRITVPVESVSIGPTLTAMAGIHDPIDRQFQAKALPLNARGSSPEDRSEEFSYSETVYPFMSFGWSPLHAAQTSRYHYIDAPRAELYELEKDPHETTNIAGQQPAVVAAMREMLIARLRANPFLRGQNLRNGLTPEAADKLRSLGYIAYGSPESQQNPGTTLADPKDKIGELNAILQASDAFRANDFARGEHLLAQVREHDPTMYVVPYMLGEAALRHGKVDQAANYLQEALKLAPEFDQATTALARALYLQGDSPGAKQWLNRALERNPENYRAWYALGVIESKTDPPAAGIAFRKTLSIQPSFGFAERDLGIMLFEQKNYKEAAQHLGKAIALRVEDARIHNFLGICFSRMSQLQRAVASYKQALQLAPDLAEAHLNLSYAYQRQNRPEDARREAQAACRLEQRYCNYVLR
jgi:choline-sulfatase